MTQEPNTPEWKARFAEKFEYKGKGRWLTKYPGFYDENEEFIESPHTGYLVPQDILDFIASEVDKAREQQNKEFVKFLQLTRTDLIHGDLDGVEARLTDAIQRYEPPRPCPEHREVDPSCFFCSNTSYSLAKYEGEVQR